MISSSVRRVGFIAPQVPIIASFTNSAPRAAASQVLSYRSHQRRLSSSKPSSPPDESNGVAAGENVPEAPSQSLKNKVKTGKEKKAGAEKKAGIEKADGETKPQMKNKRKAKNVPASSLANESEEAEAIQNLPRNKAIQNPPSVPSTHHITPSHIAAANFFSLHRPISITMSIPQPVTEKAFATIFRPASKPSADVITTLSNTLQNLDTATGQMRNFSFGPRQSQWNSETDEMHSGITAEAVMKAEMKNINGSSKEPAMEFPHHILSGKYQPFHPPPPPVPQATLESIAAESQEPQHRRYSAWLTIDESTNENGEVTYSSRLHPEEAKIMPTRFLGRMQTRQERSRVRAEERGYWAISVKRQRKLKMKKHKYKKLMRRTRNLRRKLDRN